MAYTLLKSPQMIETIQKSGGYFFHGTNANALSSILKYGINSVEASIENKINVNTGEEWSRIGGKRDFVSITDCLDVALCYSSIKPKKDDYVNKLLNFGVVIGISMENMKNLRTFSVMSDIPEVGIKGNLPLDHIKFLAVPEDKTEFVKKMVGAKNIEVVSMDIYDRFYSANFTEKYNMIEQEKDASEELTKQYPSYRKEDVIQVVNNRKVSKVKEIFEILKKRIRVNTKETNERG